MSNHHSICRRPALAERFRLGVATLAVAIGLGLSSGAFGATTTEDVSFGSNPGNLRMFKFVPDGLATGRPLVVALHGCTQTALSYDDETGWTALAERLRFALLLPQQRQGSPGGIFATGNHPLGCFNWFLPGDISRDQGEALSIKQMIDAMKADHGSDSTKVFVTGLSAGGAMTAVMLATYPEVFAGGAVIAGLPYRCATSESEATSQCLRPGKNLSPAQWGSLVRNASPHTGPWPKVSIWHGTADTTVAPMNAAELVDQWTNVHGIDRTPDITDTVQGHTHEVFTDAGGKPQVEIYTIADMGHGTPVDPGPGPEQCGRAGAFILDAGICSSLQIVRFWGLGQPPDGGNGNGPPVDRAKLLERLDDVQQAVDGLRNLIQQLP
jgi:poly(hydroxyalkanoate) depolymerase family esterase